MLTTMWNFGNTPNGRESLAKQSLSPTKESRKQLRENSIVPRGGNIIRPPGIIIHPPGIMDQNHSYSESHPGSLQLSDEILSVSQTNHGVEVALDWDVAMTPKVAVVQYDVKKASKIHRCQFSMDYPMQRLGLDIKNAAKGRITQQHRVPLQEPPEIEGSSLEDHMFLLQSYAVRNELSSIQAECNRLNTELQALEDDRMELEHKYLRIPNPTTREITMRKALWDLNYLLREKQFSVNTSHPNLSHEDISNLQVLRGCFWTLQLSSKTIREQLCSKLIRDGNIISKHKSQLTIEVPGISHVNLIPSCNKSGSTSFFFHTDRGQSFGQIPIRLQRRMKKHSLHLDMLNYLTTGPNGAYYASFQSGHEWWGMADLDFIRLVQEWPVHRVAFGHTTTISNSSTHLPSGMGENSHSSKKITAYGIGRKKTKKRRLFSWIVTSRDGRVAFKNIPSRLAHLLETRVADQLAPAELSLGSEGSYFIKFLDGTADYCLPQYIMNVCSNIEKKGGKITNILLHPQLSKEFLIRHTDFKCGNTIC